MNKSKKKVKKNEQKISKEKSKLRNRLLKIITVLFCMGVIICCIIGIVLTFFVVGVIKERASIDISNLDLNYTTIIYANDKQGNPYELDRLHSVENREWVDIDELPDYIGNAAIAIEDRRFMKHSGVDIKRTFSAFVNEIFHIYGGRQGGSTITQQLIKNITGDNKVHALRKVREMVSALFLEKHATKMEILEAYLNVIYLGYNTNGVAAAARLYFDKQAKDLTLLESAALIAITKNPAKYDLFVHPENNRQRREYILGKMLEFGFISQKQFDEASLEKIKLSSRNGPKKNKKKINSYFVDYLIGDVIDSLVEKYGFTTKYAAQQIYRGGYRIYSTVDERIQNILQERFENSSAFSRITGGKEDVQAAMVILDANGGIVGMVGGRGEKTINRGLNRASDTKRQPGSAIKPVSLYSLAIEKNVLNFSSLVKDEPFSKLNDKNWPRNAYGNYYGNVLLPYAIEQSSNAVAVHVCNMLDPNSCFNFMKNKLKIDSLVEGNEINGKIFTDKTLASMALGALTDGMNVLELTAAYQIFANGGFYTKPHAYSKVVNSEGEVVLEVSNQPERVISKSTAMVMNKLLQRVITSGTGRGARIGGVEQGGKTGTTSEDKDVWFVGFTPKYIAGVWVGYDKPTEMRNLWPNYPPTNIWREVMEKVHEGIEPGAFFSDQSVVTKEYCRKTGLVASPTCAERGTGYYRSQNVPQTCSGNHVMLEAPKPAEGDVQGQASGSGTQPSALTQAVAQSQENVKKDQATGAPMSSAGTAHEPIAKKQSDERKTEEKSEAKNIAPAA